MFFSCRILSEKFYYIWKQNKFRTRILLPSEKNNKTIGYKLLAYFPYLYYCAGIFSMDHVVQIGFFHTLSSRLSYKSIFNYTKRNYFLSAYNPSTFFMSNVPKNLRQCRLKLAFSAWPPYIINIENKEESGIEGELIHLLAERLNVKFQMNEYAYRDGNMLHLIANANISIKRERDFQLIVSKYSSLFLFLI